MERNVPANLYLFIEVAVLKILFEKVETEQK